MPRSIMAAIIVLGLPRQKFSHYRGNALFAAFKQNMDVITHEDPGLDRAFALCDIPAQAFKETGLVLIVLEDDGLYYTLTMI
jgi:hypothetical protein